MSSMPTGMESSQDSQSAQEHSTPLDGVTPPTQPKKSMQKDPQHSTVKQQKQLLLVVLGIGGVFMLFVFLFAFYLMFKLPAPDGGGQGLKLFGNVFYGTVSVLAIVGMVLITLRLIRAGVSRDTLQLALLRPGILAVLVIGVSVIVFASINRVIPLSIDILEPLNLQGLTAPTSITFGTSTLRSVLRKQGLTPRKYKWDFDGDGKTDADTEEHEVTTVYKRKGMYNVTLKMLLSNGKVRSARKRLVIPHAVFSMEPNDPIQEEVVIFDATHLVVSPEQIEALLWDFNGDDTVDIEGPELRVEHIYKELGTVQTRVIIQHKGGLQEQYVLPVTVLKEREQPFDIAIVSEGDLKGATPLGVILKAEIEEGVQASSVRWTFFRENGSDRENSKIEELRAERVSHVFTQPGTYIVSLEVSDAVGRTARKSIKVDVFEPLQLNDVSIIGTPKPTGRVVEGIAPLEVKLSASTRTPFITFDWEQEGAENVFSTEDRYHALYAIEGEYPIVLIARDADGRAQKTALTVRVLPPRSRVEFTAVPPTGIAPLSVTFDASQSSVPDERITGFAWMFGDGGRDEKEQLLGSQVTHRYEKEGTYTVIVKALTESGRSYDARKTIVVRKPVLDACVFPSRTAGEAPLGVRFDAGCSTGQITSYMWDFGDGTTAENMEPIHDHVYKKPGSYRVILEVSDGQGGLGQETIEITVRSP